MLQEYNNAVGPRKPAEQIRAEGNGKLRLRLSQRQSTDHQIASRASLHGQAMNQLVYLVRYRDNY